MKHFSTMAGKQGAPGLIPTVYDLRPISSQWSAVYLVDLYYGITDGWIDSYSRIVEEPALETALSCESGGFNFYGGRANAHR